MKKVFATVVIVGCLARAIAVSADVTGKVILQGNAPEMKVIDMSGAPECAKLHPDPVTEETVVTGDKGQLKNVVVSIKKEDLKNVQMDVPKSPAVLDQKGGIYEPHVLAMMVGQDLLIKNSDPFMHNAHSLATTNDVFNVAMFTANNGIKVDPQPRAAETFAVKCDVHPWMSAWIAVFDHPYFSVTGDDGTFDIKNLPDGTYTLQAWQEHYGSQEQKITVKDGKAEATFTFKADVHAGGAPAKALGWGNPQPAIAMLNCPVCTAAAKDSKP